MLTLSPDNLGVHEFLQEMHREVLSHYPGIVTVGETPFTHHDFDVLVPYVLPENKELQMIFQFEQQEVDGYPPLVHENYTLAEFKAITSRWQVAMQERGGWNSIYLEVRLDQRTIFGAFTSGGLSLQTFRGNKKLLDKFSNSILCIVAQPLPMDLHSLTSPNHRIPLC